jgi:hypothetical protein
MKYPNYIALRVISGCILVLSLVLQSLFITNLWLGFDSRVSCERLIRWDEWISCMHGMSHLYVIASEIAVGSWLVAVAAAFAARSLPPYISLVFPGSMAAICLWWMIQHWNANVVPRAPFGAPTAQQVYIFAVASGLMAVYLAGPAAGAWLLGFLARARRRSSLAGFGAPRPN